MQTACPPCDRPLRLSPPARTMQEAPGVDRQLPGDESFCADGRTELAFYFF